MKRPHILITNDDGIQSPGIKHLWNAIKEKADVTIVAPAYEQSAVSLSITIRQPLRIEKVEWATTSGIWSVNGTPSDCVKMALSVILPNPPDLILSGINRGTNAGRNVLYSGTIGAIIEGTMRDIPGVAFSLGGYYHPPFDQVEPYIPQVVDYLLKYPLPKGTFLNVNFPEGMSKGIKGFRMARQGRQYWIENPEERHHPSEGRSYYWLGARLTDCEEPEDSDVKWLREGYATAVPIHIGELTDRLHIDHHRDIFESFVN
jgi:5'-nucleotidase